jgi:hypothetical protein
MSASQPGRAYLVHMPLAEARHLAGVGDCWPATPQLRLAAALREWLAGISRRRSTVISARKVIADLTLILEAVPLPQRPLHGPFGPASSGPPLPGQVNYLGGGIVRLNEDALSSLASLAPDDDYRVIHTDVGPVLSVGADTYLARVEEPDNQTLTVALPVTP